MLVLTRKAGESILIGDDVEVTIVKTTGSRVRLSIRAPREISIRRAELHDEPEAVRYAAASETTASASPEQVLAVGHS